MANRTYKLETVKTTPMTVIYGLLMAAALFLVLPLTQVIGNNDDDNKDLRAVNYTLPPPPLDFEEPPPPPEETVEVTVEQLDTPPPEISLSALGASLQAGTGGVSLAAGLDDFASRPDALGEMIFSIRDLDRVPRRLSGRPPEYPVDLRRNRVEGFVRLSVIIDENGKVTVEEVLESSHRAFERPAIDSAESCTFEKPTKDGQAVKVRYIFPFDFKLN